MPSFFAASRVEYLIIAVSVSDMQDACQQEINGKRKKRIK
jgi:predicted GIY-YIG superfamily endonuclease